MLTLKKYIKPQIDKLLLYTDYNASTVNLSKSLYSLIDNYDLESDWGNDEFKENLKPLYGLVNFDQVYVFHLEVAFLDGLHKMFSDYLYKRSTASLYDLL